MRTAPVFRTRSVTSSAGSTEVHQVLAILPMPVSFAIDTKGLISRPSTFPATRSDFSIPGVTYGTSTSTLSGPVIQPMTPVGEVTARVLRLNAAERVIERQVWQAFGQYRID